MKTIKSQYKQLGDDYLAQRARHQMPTEYKCLQKSHVGRVVLNSRSEWLLAVNHNLGRNQQTCQLKCFLKTISSVIFLLSFNKEIIHTVLITF